jgi:hypothetical protein
MDKADENRVPPTKLMFGRTEKAINSFVVSLYLGEMHSGVITVFNYEETIINPIKKAIKYWK